MSSQAHAGIARTPKPPYWAVIFSSRRTDGDQEYGAMAERMATLASQQPGYLGMESVREEGGLGITVSYWVSEDAIARWREHAEHRMAQERGKAVWYQHYELRIARVERAYGK